MNPKEYYGGTAVDWYQFAHENQLNHHEFSILKRIIRLKGKGEEDLDIDKIIDVIEMLEEAHNIEVSEDDVPVFWACSLENKALSFKLGGEILHALSATSVDVTPEMERSIMCFSQWVYCREECQETKFKLIQSLEW